MAESRLLNSAEVVEKHLVVPGHYREDLDKVLIPAGLIRDR